MHPSAKENFLKFLKTYLLKWKQENLEKTPKFLDVGSYNVNGCLRDILIQFYKENKEIVGTFEYIGMDQESGPNVDLVCNSHKMSLEDKSFDFIVSSSCFEHDPLFWKTFKEISRVLRENGYIYINAPSSSVYHAYPIDCWRFYKDSWKALAEYCPSVKLIESYVDFLHYENQAQWNDSVGIYSK